MSMKLSEEQKRQNAIAKTENRLRALSPVNQINDVARVFQKLVRLKAADINGMVTCFTCDKQIAWNLKGTHAGHFIVRKHRGTVFDFRNCHPQCYHCNEKLKGNAAVYQARMIETYGQHIVEELLHKSTSVDRYPVETLAAMRHDFLALCRHEIKRLK